MWLFYLGLFVLINFLYDCLKSPVQMLHHKWLQHHNKVPSLCERYGKWAAVTGSTDGIGKAYAKELARLGLNIVLISRSETKLQQVAKEIENEFGVQTMIVQTDFSQGPKVYDHLYRELAKKPIGILVNNVGIGHNPPGTVATFAPDHLWHMININIAAATLLSRYFVDKWLHNDIKGCIVNISSGLELQPVPYGSVYGATKAYLRSFTLALQNEVKRYGIAVQLVSPAFVRTNINTYSAVIMKGNIFIPRSEQYAKWAVSNIGVVSETTGYFWHGVQTTIWKMIPGRLRSLLIVYMSKFLVDDLTNFETSGGCGNLEKVFK